MKYIFFLIPFFLIASLGIHQDAAALETRYGENYNETFYPDGTVLWQSAAQRLFNGNDWVDFIAINSTLIDTAHGKVKINTDGSYTIYKNNTPLLTDQIVAKYADVSNLNSWTYPNTLNGDTPEISWDGEKFVSSKFKSGIGQLDYVYINDNGKWKTQLEATNLSGLTSKAFGFDQIIDLNSDTIRFGGQNRNLDNFNGTVFDKTWIDNNEGKIIDFLNGMLFDFDISIYNLHSITVYDTGANKSRLVFDFRTDMPLLPNETLILDPTFTSSVPSTEGSLLSTSVAGTACSTSYASSVGTLNIKKSASGASDQCRSAWFTFDTASIVGPVTSVSNATLTFDVISFPSGAGATECDIKHLGFTATTDNATYNAITNDIGDVIDVVSNSALCTTISNNKVAVFSSSAYTRIVTDINTDDIVSLGIFFADPVRPASDIEFNLAAADAVLTITYSTTPPPDKINDLTYANLSTNSLDLLWTQPGLNGGNLTNYLINYTTPFGNPQTFLANTTNTYYNVTGLTFGTDYSFRVSALTEAGYNATGNILNVTTTSNEYATPPVLTVFANGTNTTSLNLEFPSSTMQNINGYRIQRETPIGTGWSTIVSNTTSSTQYYNNTGLTTNIIYNYRVYAMNNSGISTVSNTYDMTTFHLPDAVDDLTGSATDLSTIDLSWSAPTSYAPEIIGYMINGTTPVGDPVDILSSNTGTTATTATALNLLIGQEYSFRVSPITVHGMNASGNIWNGSTIQTFVIGNLSNPDITNDDDFSIFFDRTDVNSTTIQLEVTYPNSYDLSCDFAYKYARTNQTYSSLTSVPNGTDNQVATFTLVNATGDLVQVRCWDVLTNDESTYVITITDFPFLQQVNNLRNGEDGTFFQIGAFDGVMLIIIFLGMVGLNRTTPIVGIVFVIITTLVMSYFELITYPIIMYPALIMMVVWAFVTTRKDD